MSHFRVSFLCSTYVENETFALICVHDGAAVRNFSQWRRKLRLEESFSPIGPMRTHGCKSGIFAFVLKL